MSFNKKLFGSFLWEKMMQRTMFFLQTALDAVEIYLSVISKVVGMSDSAVSHQLKILKNAKLVGFRRDGKTVFYSLADDHVTTIINQGLDHINE